MAEFDLVCLSHLRWDFVFQRPQQLMSRCARERRVFFVEEPVFEGDHAELKLRTSAQGVQVAVPFIPAGLTEEDAGRAQKKLLAELFTQQNINDYALWYYTPLALTWTDTLAPLATVYDCMDELSAFQGASPALLRCEQELLARADLVFTGGQSLYEAKQARHPHVHAFPSSVDVLHFAQARQGLPDPIDQAAIAHPRLGFFGVIDERLDLALLREVAALHPDWQWVIIGPVVKIDHAALPQAPNIHYLGGKSYDDLPAYLAHWDAALLLFARTEATRFISPTKTPEYLAAGKPVVSTSIRDVVRPYGDQDLVRIADTPEAFVAACALALAEDNTNRQARADTFLSQTSWDKTWRQMADLLEAVVDTHAAQDTPPA